MVNNIEDYPWSSYKEYAFNEIGIADTTFVLEMLPGNEFVEFHQADEENIFIVDDKVKVSDDGIRRDIIKRFGYEPNKIGELDRIERNAILHELKEKYSIRQIERVTGISRGVIARY